MSSFNKFNVFVADIANKVHNLGSDVLKAMLTDVAPVATNAIRTDIMEIAAINGYTAGGAPVRIASSAQSGGTYTLLQSANPSWTATGAAIAQFRYVVLYNSTAASGNLIGWWDTGAEQNVASGNTFIQNLDPINGILQLA
jgi:hypothetical protein